MKSRQSKTRTQRFKLQWRRKRKEQNEKMAQVIGSKLRGILVGNNTGKTPWPPRFFSALNDVGLLEAVQSSGQGPESLPQALKMGMKSKHIRVACLIVSVAVLGFAILYGSGDSGNTVLWGIAVAASLIGIFWGLMGFKKPN